MQTSQTFTIHRIITGNAFPTSLSKRIRYAATCLKQVSKEILEPVTVIQTPGGFLFDYQNLELIQTGLNSKKSDFTKVVKNSEKFLKKFLTDELVKILSVKADFATFGVDIFDTNSKKHAELVATFNVKKGEFKYWTGKSYPVNNQVNTLLYCVDLDSHFQHLNETPVLVLGCHDLNIFSPRSRRSCSAGTYKGKIISKMQKFCDKFKPQVVLQHPHSTDSPRIWSTAWSGIRKYIPSVKVYSAGIHYANVHGGATRQPLERVLSSTAVGKVENTIVK